MERVLTQEERIRRAEEIYLRRRTLQTPQPRMQSKERNTENSEPIKAIKLFKRIGLQIIVCLLLYCIFYLIYDTNFSFSDITINKTEEILNYDINMKEMYTNLSTYFNNLIRTNEEEQTEENGKEQEIEENINEINDQEQSEETQIQSETTVTTEEPPIQQSEVEETQETSVEEISLKKAYTLIKPLERRICFFGIR